MAPTFHFREQLLGDEWDTARGFLVEEFDNLYATLQAVDDSTNFVSVVFDPSHFTGSAEMIWTVTSAEVVTWGYSLANKIMTVMFDLRQTTVGGVPSSALVLAIPGVYVAKRTCLTACYLRNNGSAAIGVCYVLANGRTIRCEIVPIGAWAVSVNNTQVAGQITFEVV